MVSVDGGVPLVSRAYPGNLPDVTQFPLMVDELAARFATLCETAAVAGDRLTLVFDAGQKSGDNVALLDDLPVHFVGSVAPSDHPDLLAVPMTKYRPVTKKRFLGLLAYETASSLRSPPTFLGARRGTRKSKERVEAEIAATVKPRWVAR